MDMQDELKGRETNVKGTLDIGHGANAPKIKLQKGNIYTLKRGKNE